MTKNYTVLFFVGSLFAQACTKNSGEVGRLTLVLDKSHPATVLATGEAVVDDCTIEWSAGDDDVRTAVPDMNDTTLSAVLVGATASTEVGARIICGDSAGPLATIVTGDFPDDLPSLAVSQELTQPLSEEFVLTSGFNMTTGAGSITISNLAGKPVWWESSPGALINDAHYDAENGLVYGVMWAKGDDVGAEFFLAGMAGETRLWPIENLHHDSLALGDGRYLITQSVIEETEEYGEVTGDTLAIFDTETELTTVVWNSFDQLMVTENDGWALQPPDWTHLNGLSFDPENGKVYVSLYSDRSILQVDATSWQTDWQLGGDSSDFVVDVDFGPQHSPLHQGNKLYMFNNGRDVAAGSEPVGYTLVVPTTETVGTATRSWNWSPPVATYSLVMGSIELEQDASLAAWGDSGEVRIISPNDGSLLAYYEQRLGGQAGQTSFIDLP